MKNLKENIRMPKVIWNGKELSTNNTIFQDILNGFDEACTSYNNERKSPKFDNQKNYYDYMDDSVNYTFHKVGIDPIKEKNKFNYALDKWIMGI